MRLVRVISTGRVFVVEHVEIPRVDKDRIFVLERLSNGALRLVDDFISPTQPFERGLAEVHCGDGKLVYFSREKKVLRETNYEAEPVDEPNAI